MAAAHDRRKQATEERESVADGRQRLGSGPMTRAGSCGPEPPEKQLPCLRSATCTSGFPRPYPGRDCEAESVAPGGMCLHRAKRRGQLDCWSGRERLWTSITFLWRLEVETLAAGDGPRSRRLLACIRLVTVTQPHTAPTAARHRNERGGSVTPRSILQFPTRHRRSTSETFSGRETQ